MKIHHQLDQLPDFRNAVLTIGSFDGVHKGHQHIIAQLKELAQKVLGETIVLTFEPHPRIVLAKQRSAQVEVQLITTLAEKAFLLEQYGIDHLVVVPFTKAFSDQSPDAYIEKFLVAKFQPKQIVIGYDHRFGKGRSGNIDYLRKFEAKYAFKVAEISKHEVNNIAVSSTKVRAAIAAGQVARAYKLLGHSFNLTGKVVQGQQIGRELGFPTANLVIQNPHKIIPPNGIYAVLAHYKSQIYKGMLYIGNRPTVDKGLARSIEVHIFQFQQSIYDQELRLDFIQYLRGDAKFETMEELKTQLKLDQAAALAALANIEIAPNKYV